MKRRNYKIGFDARMVAHSGIGSRVQGVLRELSTVASKRGIEITLLGNRNTLEEKLGSKIFGQYGFLPYDAEIYSLREWAGISRMKDFDLLDIPHFNAPIRYLDRCIVTIHDIIPFRMREFHSSFLKQTYLRFVFSRIRKKAKAIVTVSDFTAKDVEEVFSISRERMITIYNGIDSKAFHQRSDAKIRNFRKKYDLEQNYLLSVGIGKEHKNLGFVLRSFRKLWSEKLLDRTWVIAGASGKLPEYLRKDAEGWEDKIKVLPYLTEDELATLYSGAGLLVYPSLYEGFGFPPVEAQACGCPVLSSDASVLPEILGGTAFYFDPKNHSEFESELLSLLGSKRRLHSKEKSGIKNSKRFDWKKTAEQIVLEYLSVLGK